MNKILAEVRKVTLYLMCLYINKTKNELRIMFKTPCDLEENGMHE